jgi:hypothetical protein
MVNNSTNINKMNNHFSPQLTSYKKIPRHWKAVIIDSSKKDINNKHIFKLKSSTRHTRVVVQVPWLPEVTEGYVTPLVFPWVYARATGSCAISIPVEWCARAAFWPELMSPVRLYLENMGALMCDRKCPWGSL